MAECEYCTTESAGQSPDGLGWELVDVGVDGGLCRWRRVTGEGHAMAGLSDERLRRLLKAVQHRFEMSGSEDDLLLKDCLCELLERRALAEARQPAGEAVERKSVTISGAIDEYLSHPEHRTAEMPSRQPSVRMAQAERLVEYEAGRRAGIEEAALWHEVEASRLRQIAETHFSGHGVRMLNDAASHDSAARCLRGLLTEPGDG
jgi:hypothetical protein